MQPGADDRARVHVWVTGRVQGVGFRAYVQQVSARLDLTGWVRNMGYNQVEAVAEGHRSALEHFVEEVRRGPRAASVEESRVEWEIATGEFQYFDARRSV